VPGLAPHCLGYRDTCPDSSMSTPRSIAELFPPSDGAASSALAVSAGALPPGHFGGETPAAAARKRTISGSTPLPPLQAPEPAATMKASEAFLAQVSQHLPALSGAADLPESWVVDLSVVDALDAAMIARAHSSLNVATDLRGRITSLGVFASALEGMGKYVVKLVRKLRQKRSVIRSLEVHVEKGTMPPTLVIRVPESMSQDTAYRRLGGASHAAFLEAFTTAEKAALTCTVELRRQELEVIAAEITAVRDPVKLIERLVTSAYADPSVDIAADSGILPALRFASRRFLVVHMTQVLGHLSDIEFKIHSELAVEDALAAKAAAAKAARKSVSFAPDAGSAPMETDGEGVDAAATPATKADINRLTAELARRDKAIEALKRGVLEGKHQQKGPGHKPRAPNAPPGTPPGAASQRKGGSVHKGAGSGGRGRSPSRSGAGAQQRRGPTRSASPGRKAGNQKQGALPRGSSQTPKTGRGGATTSQRGRGQGRGPSRA
jgi:hypothetical protein